MEKIINSSLTQIENVYQDVMLMHSTLIYNSNCDSYFFRDTDSAPAYEWFTQYNHLYSGMKALGISMSRAVSGVGVFKADGSTCISGTLSTPVNFPEIKETLLDDSIRSVNDTVFFVDKAPGEQNENLNKYMFCGRLLINSMGEVKSAIVTKIRDDLFKLALSEAVWPNGFTLVLDNEYDSIYDSAPNMYSDHKENFLRQLQEGNGAILSESYTVFYTTSKNIGISVVSAIPNHYIRENYRGISTKFLVSLLLFIVTEALLSMVISNKIVHRLYGLEQTMERVGGDSAANSLVIQGDDEVSRLGRTYLRMVEQINKLMEDIKSNERQKRLAEIKILRAQISPHFLYNTLNTIGYLALIQNAKNIHSLVLSLINLLQGAIHVDDELIPLEEEINYVKSYLNLQQYRFQRLIQTDFMLDPSTGGNLVPKMILQPIVENSILHGLQDSQDDPVITIKAYVMEKILNISITDNGTGMSEKQIHDILAENGNLERQRFSSIGIGNVHTRIQLQFGDEYGLHIYSREGIFTTVEIRLPVITAKE